MSSARPRRALNRQIESEQEIAAGSHQNRPNGRVVRRSHKAKNLIGAGQTTILGYLPFLLLVCIQSSRAQIRLIESNNIESERAFISAAFQAYQIGNDTEKKPVLGVFVSLNNNGGTPTKRLVHQIACEPSVNVPIEPWKLLEQRRIEATQTLIGAHSNDVAACTFTIEQVQQMADGKLHGYVVGEVRYRDRVVDPTADHRTEYALELFAPSVSSGNGTFTVSSIPIQVGNHNCADEDCPPD